MGTPGPPGGFDIQNFFKTAPPSSLSSYTPPSAPYPPPNHPYQTPTPPYSMNNFGPSNSYTSANSFPSIPGSYPYSSQGSVQPGMYHPYMHYGQEHGPRPPPYPAAPFSQAPQQTYAQHQASYSQASPNYSQTQPTYNSQPQPPSVPHAPPPQSISQVPGPVSSGPQGQAPSQAASPPLNGAHLMALLTTQSAAEATGKDDSPALLLPRPSLLELPPPVLSSSDSSHGELSVPPPAIAPALPTAPPVNFAPASTRLPGNKPPRGRSLKGDHVVCDVDVRYCFESQPQLEVSPITVYGSDPVLVLGRQIAVNRSYICYGLRAGTIRILNINTALRVLLRGHSQRVTDMVFFSEDVHLLASASTDGRIFVRKIVEGTAEDGRMEIKDQILVALQIVGDWESVHPRVCWHSHMQDLLVVGIGKYVLTIDVVRVRANGPPGGFTVEDTMVCNVHSPIDGVRVVGEHDGDVTDLSVPLWSPTCLASASQDGTVRIWGDKNLSLLSVIEPHQRQPVDSVALISAPRRPDLAVLITAGPLNRELKLWAEGVTSKPGGGNWQCVQTLELKSSASEGRVENAFFNQVLVVPRASLIVLANAKKNAIYVVHLDFGSTAAATRMDYLAEFSVTMPILSLTATSESVSDGDGTVQVYCVQTQAIQQYALDLCQCLPPPEESSIDISPGSDKIGMGAPSMHPTVSSQGFHSTDTGYSSNESEVSTTVTGSSVVNRGGIMGASVPSLLSTCGNHPLEGSSSFDQTSISSETVATFEAKLGIVNNPVTVVDIPDSIDSDVHDEAVTGPHAAVPFSPSFLKRSSHSESPTKVSEDGYVLVSSILPGSIDNCEGVLKEPSVSESALADVGILESSSANQPEDEQFEKESEEGAPGMPTSNAKVTQQQSDSGIIHLITPSELMSIVARSKASELDSTVSPALSTSATDAGKEDDFTEEGSGPEKPELSVESGFSHRDVMGKEAEYDTTVLQLDTKQKNQVGVSLDYSNKEFGWDCNSSGTAYQEGGPGDESQLMDDGELMDESQSATNFSPEDVQEIGKEANLRAADLSVVALPLQASAVTKGRKNKNKTSVGVGAVTLSTTPSHVALPTSSTAAICEGETSTSVSSGAVDMSLALQVASMQESLNQLVSMQKELHKQMTLMVAVPVAKEGKRMEGALGLRMEKLLKAHVDAMWARIQEESVKREKLERDRVQQLTTLLSNSFNKDLLSALERVFKKELTSLGPAVARLVTPNVEKLTLTAVNENFQKSLVDKVVPQLEKVVTAKIDTVVTRQLHMQFQTNLKQALQDSLRACFETTVIPSFERSCQAMFEQVDSTLLRGLAEHTANAQQHFEATHTTLATTLQETMLSASSLAASLKGELSEGQRKLISLAENAGANAARASLSASKQNNGGLPDKVLSLQHLEESLDPTIELSRLVAERKLEEAFNKALSLSDVAIVSWLCNQVDMKALFSLVPPPLSQGVLLSLVQQLGCDLGKDTAHKLEWIKEGALALNPKDPVLAPHMRPFLEQLYQNLHRQMHLISGGELATSMRLVLHIVNSLLSACK